MAQQLFQPVSHAYLLSEHSLPHVTICQFDCASDDEAHSLWNQIEKLILPFPIQFTGMSFIKGWGIHEEYYWAELSVARDHPLIEAHQKTAHFLQSKGYSCINDTGNLYRPHLTLARIKLPSFIPSWSDAILKVPTSYFQYSLGRADSNGQYIKILSQKNHECAEQIALPSYDNNHCKISLLT